MSKTLEITIGDTGLSITGRIVAAALKQFSSSAGMSVTLTLIGIGVGNAVTDASAQITGFDQATGTVFVGYRLQTGDVDTGGKYEARWTLTLADGGKIHSPGPSYEQTFYKINN